MHVQNVLSEIELVTPLSNIFPIKNTKLIALRSSRWLQPMVSDPRPIIRVSITDLPRKKFANCLNLSILYQYFINRN